MSPPRWAKNVDIKSQGRLKTKSLLLSFVLISSTPLARTYPEKAFLFSFKARLEIERIKFRRIRNKFFFPVDEIRDNSDQENQHR